MGQPLGAVAPNTVSTLVIRDWSFTSLPDSGVRERLQGESEQFKGLGLALVIRDGGLEPFHPGDASHSGLVEALVLFVCADDPPWVAGKASHADIRECTSFAPRPVATQLARFTAMLPLLPEVVSIVVTLSPSHGSHVGSRSRFDISCAIIHSEEHPQPKTAAFASDHELAILNMLLQL